VHSLLLIFHFAGFYLLLLADGVLLLLALGLLFRLLNFLGLIGVFLLPAFLGRTSGKERVNVYNIFEEAPFNISSFLNLFQDLALGLFVKHFEGFKLLSFAYLKS